MKTSVSVWFGIIITSCIFLSFNIGYISGVFDVEFDISENFLLEWSEIF